MDHRSYQSIVPTHNKLLQKRWDQQRFSTHRGKVRSASCIVDTRAPKAHMHVQMKMKKQQLEEERLAVIERDNRMLLEKMSHIMRSRGRVDDRNVYEHKSLNKEKREQELLRVAEENKGILRRLQAVKPLYNRQEWEDDFLEHETFLESVSMYPLGPHTWPGKKPKRHHTRSAGGVPLPPLPSKKEQPATKAGDVKDEPDCNDQKQNEKPAAGDGQDRSDKEGADPNEQPDSDKGHNKPSSDGGGANEKPGGHDTQKVGDEGEPSTDQKNDQTGADGKEPSNQDDKQDDQLNDQQADKQGDKQDDQQNDKHVDKSGDKQEEPADDVPQKTGIDLDVEVIHRSVEGREAGPFIEVLVQHDHTYRQDLKEKYKEQYGKDLLEEIQSVFSNPLDNALCAVFRTASEFDAWCLHEAVRGLGTVERVLIEVLGSRSNESIKAVRVAYRTMYDKELEEDVQCDTSGDFEKLLLDLLKGDRAEDDNVDQELAETEAKELYEAGEDSFGTDESALIRILANRSRSQLVATFQEYEKAASCTIMDSLKSETSGDLLMGLKMLVLLALDQWKLWADRMHECLEESGREAELTRIVVGTPTNDVPSLKERYLEIYSQSLVDAANEKLSGDYAKLIVGLLGK